MPKLTNSGSISVSTSTKTVAGGNGVDIIDATNIAAVNSDGWKIAGGNGNDIIWGDSSGNTSTSDNGADTLYGGLGNDEIHGGNAGDTMSVTVSGTDISFGLNGADIMSGGLGDDALVGGGNDDTLIGGVGNDQLFGGDGRDTFRFSEFGAANTDKILDFNASGVTTGPASGFGDVIALSASAFPGLTVGALNAANFVANATGTAVDSNDYIVYNTTTKELFYDADGSGSGAAQLIATLTITTGTLDATDFVIL